MGRCRRGSGLANLLGRKRLPVDEVPKLARHGRQSWWSLGGGGRRRCGGWERTSRRASLAAGRLEWDCCAQSMATFAREWMDAMRPGRGREAVEDGDEGEREASFWQGRGASGGERSSSGAARMMMM